GTIQEKQSSSSSEHTPVIEATTRYGLALDDDAGRRIVERCRQADPTATVEEVAHFTSVKIEQLKRKPNVGNWPGLLIRAVSGYFQAPATELHRFRAQKAQERLQTIEVA